MRSDQRKGLLLPAAFVLGAILPHSLLLLVYAFAGEVEIYIKSMISIPLHYSGSQRSAFAVLRQLFLQELHWDRALLWLAAGTGLILLLIDYVRAGPRQSQGSLRLVILILGVTVSMAMSGASWGHYIIQIIPLACLVAGYCFYRLSRAVYPPLIAGLTLMALLLSASPMLEQYQRAARLWTNGTTHKADKVRMLADKMNELNPAKEPVFMTNYHIAYWFTGVEPPTDIVHPSNLALPGLLGVLRGRPTSAREELARILAGKPRLIVRGRGEGYLRRHVDAFRLLEDTIARDYVQKARFRDIRIYARRNG